MQELLSIVIDFNGPLMAQYELSLEKFLDSLLKFMNLFRL